jgi:N utilization substance protein A
MKGSRVQSIIKELRGEKIDIIEWSDRAFGFRRQRAFASKVSQVRITNINNRKMEVIVGEDQLVWQSASAVKMCGWRRGWLAGTSILSAKKF